MDSLTQITLGAACGELVAGKKIGNRAMVWGALAGTIPDLDVFVGNLMDPVTNLAFHRGISHSFFFAVVFSFLMAWITNSIYSSGIHQKKGTRVTMFSLGMLFLAFCAFIAHSFISLLAAGGDISWSTIVVSILLISGLGYLFWTRYVAKEQSDVDLSYKKWYLFFFVAIVTHPILDSFTTYGTQLFQPFSKLRVSWDNISVADPLYTVPFIVLLLITSFFKKGSKTRTRFAWAAVIVSSLYMAWTFSNKVKVNKVFHRSLAQQEISYNRCLTTPTILNNLLWQCVAEDEEYFYNGFYSILDKEPIIKEIFKIPKNLHLLPDTEDDYTVQTLRWFSNDYSAYMELENDTIQINDMRYGTFGDNKSDPKDYIFKFKVFREEPGGPYKMKEAIGGPPEGDQSQWLEDFFTRMWGI